MEDIFLPVLESAVVLASHYAKACGRNTVTAQDMNYGLMFAARRVTGNQIGSLFPEIYDSEDSDESDLDVVDDTDEPFTRYEGDDDIMNQMNKCADEWDEWEPETPAETILKNAVNKARGE